MDICLYLLIINILSFLLYGLDKNYARKNKFRISEKILIGIQFLGGMIGSVLAMYVFHHKTKKMYFKLSIFLSFVMWFILLTKK